MAPSFNSPKQELEQGICGQHGWSSSYFQAPSSRWCVEVRWGVGPRNGRVFVSDDVSDGASKAGVKKGHAAAAAVAIEGLRDIVYAANSKPTLTIEEAFGAQFDHTCFVMSGPLGWAKLWEINPTEVFIDVEGNQVTPPVLVQVCVPFRNVYDVTNEGTFANINQSLFADAALCAYKRSRDAEIDCHAFLYRQRQRVSYFQTMLQLLWTVTTYVRRKRRQKEEGVPMPDLSRM